MARRSGRRRHAIRQGAWEGPLADPSIGKYPPWFEITGVRTRLRNRVQAVEVSSADRVLFPDSGITKGEVVAYYAAVAARMLPYMARRPLTLERYPKGIAEKGFMQKNAGKHFPDYIERMEMPKRDGVTVHPVVTNEEGVAYLANQGTITFHSPASTRGNVRVPDRLVLDLDPSVDDVGMIRDAVLSTKAFLDALELPSLLLATGSKGYHLVVPVREASFDDTGHLAHMIATLLAAQHPDLLTQKFLKKDRGKRVLVDWMRNGWWATSVVPWSIRPRLGAPVATPLAWSELPNVGPAGMRLFGAFEREDPWPDLEGEAVAIGSAVEATQLAMDTAGLELTHVDRFGRELNPSD